MSNHQVWFITGASRGLGLAFAKAALQAGHNVVATSRNAEAVANALGQSNSLLTLSLDVTKPQAAQDAVENAVNKFGRVDVLVNNAGYGQLGPFEENSAEEIEKQYATNVFGTFHVTRAILPLMRRQRSGKIFTIGSIGGIAGGAGVSIYCSTKFALEGWSESLYPELEPFGIYATIIEPGFFNTDFLDATSVNYGAAAISDYTDFSAQIRAFYNGRNHNQIGDPIKLGHALLKLADMEKPPVRFVAGSDALERLLNKADFLRSTAEQWRQLSLSTDSSPRKSTAAETAVTN